MVSRLSTEQLIQRGGSSAFIGGRQFVEVFHQICRILEDAVLEYLEERAGYAG